MSVTCSIAPYSKIRGQLEFFIGGDRRQPAVDIIGPQRIGKCAAENDFALPRWLKPGASSGFWRDKQQSAECQDAQVNRTHGRQAS